MKKVIQYIIYIINYYNIEIFCPCCFYDELHLGHKIVKITDIKNIKDAKIQDISFESEMNQFNDITQKSINLKNKIEKEINTINELYDQTINDIKNL